MDLGKYISIREVIGSDTAKSKGIYNIPNRRQEFVLENLIKNLFEPLRNHICYPIKINSFYRSKELNSAIGGSNKSDHMILGNTAAIDLDDTFSRKYGIYNRDIFLYIHDNMDYHKLIWEYEDKLTPEGLKSPRWVHVSYSTDDCKNQEKITLYTNGKGYSHIDINKI